MLAMQDDWASQNKPQETIQQSTHCHMFVWFCFQSLFTSIHYIRIAIRWVLNSFLCQHTSTASVSISSQFNLWAHSSSQYELCTTPGIFIQLITGLHQTLEALASLDTYQWKWCWLCHLFCWVCMFKCMCRLCLWHVFCDLLPLSLCTDPNTANFAQPDVWTLYITATAPS